MHGFYKEHPKTMFMNRRTCVAALLCLVALTSSAADTIRQRGCRVGKPNPQSVTHRAPSLQGGENPYVGNDGAEDEY